MGSRFNDETVSYRNIEQQDIGPIVNYWHHSPPGFLESLGVDPASLICEAEMAQLFQGQIDALAQGDTQAGRFLMVEYCGKMVGYHNLNDIIKGESGVFHAHFLAPEIRGKGLGTYSYPRACKIYLDRFNLKKIRFISPIQNPAIHRIKEKLGLRKIEEIHMAHHLMQTNTRATVYEISRQQVEKLIRKKP